MHLLSMFPSPLNILLFSHRFQPQEMHEDSKRVDQPVHQCFLINTFLICSPESIISSFVIIAYLCSLKTRLSLTWLEKSHNKDLDGIKPVLEVCEQQRHRPACASGKTDQCLCYLPFGKYHI